MVGHKGQGKAGQPGAGATGQGKARQPGAGGKAQGKGAGEGYMGAPVYQETGGGRRWRGVI